MKHNGLAKSTRKVRPKISAKITLPQTNPKTEVTQLEPKPNPNNRRKSDNSQEKLKIFQQQETSMPDPPLTKSKSTTPTERNNKSTITTDLKPETRDKVPETMKLYQLTNHQENLETKSKKLTKPKVMKPARPPARPDQFSSTRNPPTSHSTTSATNQSWCRNANSSIQNSGGKSPPNQSESRTANNWAKRNSDWTAPDLS